MIDSRPMIRRHAIPESLKAALRRNRVVVLTGPRQCGKTTLARELLDADSINYFDLEDPVSLAGLDEPMTALRPLEGLIAIDEAQRRPDLFPVLRVLAERSKWGRLFLDGPLTWGAVNLTGPSFARAP